MKARDLLPYQIPESFLISTNVYYWNVEIKHVEIRVISIEWKEELIYGKPILNANLVIMYPSGERDNFTITFVLKEGVFTQNKDSVPQHFRYINYSEMTREEIEDSKHPTGMFSRYWGKKRFLREKAEKEAELIETQKRTVMANQVEKILSRFESQPYYMVTWAARDIVNLFTEGQASDKIESMVLRLNEEYVVPEKNMDVVVQELKSIGVYYKKKYEEWKYRPKGKKAKRDK